MPYAHFAVSLGNHCDEMMYKDAAKTEILTKVRIHGNNN